MTTEDRDIESANPSKNLKVGEFDRLSGFFTPVWESNRRVRQPADSNGGESAEEPSVANPAARAQADESAAAGSQTHGATKAGVTRGVSGKPSQSKAAAARTSSKSEAASKHEAAKGADKSASRGKSRGAKKAGASAADATPESENTPESESPALSAAADPGTTRSPEASVTSSAQQAARTSVTADVASGASTPGGAAATAPAVASLSDGPSRVATALKHAGPNPPSEAFMDSEPEFRAPLPARPAPSPPRAERPAAHFRSLVASAAATAVHERLKAKLADELPIPESRSALDSFPEELRARATPEAMSGSDPYPPQLLRRLRRTLRLSTPLPEPVRAMLAKYARN